MNTSRRLSVASLLLIPSVIAVAEVDFVIDEKQSQVDQSLALEVPFTFQVSLLKSTQCNPAKDT